MLNKSSGRRRRRVPAVHRTVAAAATLAAVGACGAGVAAAATPKEYVVLYDSASRASAARAAISDAGGRVVRENKAVGLATVRTKTRSFRADVSKAGAIDGVATNRAIGRAPVDSRKSDAINFDHATEAGRTNPVRPPLNPTMDPFSTVQWDMAMIDADFSGSYRYEQGSHDVLVGVIDTGIEAGHPISRRTSIGSSVATSRSTTHLSTARARRIPTSPARTRPTSTRAAMALTSPARSALRSTRSESAGSPRASGSSTSVPARTRAFSSCNPPSTR